MRITRRAFAGATMAVGLNAQLSETDRDYWVRMLTRVADPVLQALSRRKLKAEMPVEGGPDRPAVTHLEALGRLLSGMAPWLESGGAGQYAELARAAIAAAVDPASPDRMNFSKGSQPVVDAAFLALGVLRAPVELWQKLDAATRKQLVAAMVSTRAIQPGFNNWLLFSAMVEAFMRMPASSGTPCA